MKARLALTLALTASLASASGIPPRVARYQQEVMRYYVLMGLEKEGYSLVFTYYYHPEWCAWVAGFSQATESPRMKIFVGISYPDPECNKVSPKTLARHEMCHLRLHHLEIPDRPGFGDAEKHYEVRECMKAYEEREAQP